MPDDAENRKSLNPDAIKNYDKLIDIVNCEYHDEIEKTTKLDSRVSIYLTFAATVFVYICSLSKDLLTPPVGGWQRDLFIFALCFMLFSVGLLIYAVISLLLMARSKKYARIKCDFAIEQANKYKHEEFLRELCQSLSRNVTDGRALNNERLASVNKAISFIVSSFLLAILANVMLIII